MTTTDEKVHAINQLIKDITELLCDGKPRLARDILALQDRVHELEEARSRLLRGPRRSILTRSISWLQRARSEPLDRA